MPFQPVPQVVEVNINQRLHGEQVQNNLHLIAYSPWTQERMQVAAGEVATWVGDTLYAYLSNQLTMVSIKVTDLSGQEAGVYEFVPTVPVAGQVGQPALPGNAACVVSFRTALRGRSGRGRNYIAGIAEGDVNGNQFANTFVQAMGNSYGALAAGLGAQAMYHVVVSRFFNGNPRPEGRAAAVTSYLVDGFVDSQRRRLAGRGE